MDESCFIASSYFFSFIKVFISLRWLLILLVFLFICLLGIELKLKLKLPVILGC